MQNQAADRVGADDTCKSEDDFWGGFNVSKAKLDNAGRATVRKAHTPVAKSVSNRMPLHTPVCGGICRLCLLHQATGRDAKIGRVRRCSRTTQRGGSGSVRRSRPQGTFLRRQDGRKPGFRPLRPGAVRRAQILVQLYACCLFAVRFGQHDLRAHRLRRRVPCPTDAWDFACAARACAGMRDAAFQHC